MIKPVEDTRDRTKITDKDNTSNLNYADVMSNNSSGVLITKLEQIKATQKLVDKKILGSLVLMEDTGKSNPFRNKAGNKKRKRLERELAKLDSEALAKIPADKLARLLDAESEESDASLLLDSLREKLKALLQSTVLDEQTADDDEDKQEILAPNPAAGTAKPSPPAGHPPNIQTNGLVTGAQS